MSPQDILLKRLCGKDETFDAAKVLLRTAQAKTGPGSGYNIGAHSTGLPAICAYIASQRLCNNDIFEHVAQTSSCLKRKDFLKTLNIVRSVLDESSSRDQNASQMLSYEAIGRVHGIQVASKVTAWAIQIERTLSSTAKQGQYDRQSALVKCAVFFWICTRLKLEQVSQNSLVERYKLAPKAFSTLLKVLDKACDSLSRRIEAHAGKLDDLVVPGSSPAKGSRSPTKSPTKSSTKLPPVPSSENSSPSKTPTRRRKLAITNSAVDEDDDDDSIFPESPTKRRKTIAAKSRQSFPSTSSGTSSCDPLDALRRDFEGDIGPSPAAEMVVDPQPSPKAGPSKLSPRKHPAVRSTAEDEAETMEVDLDPSPPEHATVEWRPKRFRRVFLDHKQWLSRDPALDREWQRAEAHKKSMMALYGHPFESYRPQVCM